MVATLITEVNFPGAIAKIRETNLSISADDWRVLFKKAGQVGLTLNDMDWQVVGLAKPLEQEMIDAHNEWELEQAVVEQANDDDNSSLDNLLASAQSGLTQIANDQIALQAAASLADAKPILTNLLNRQEKIIKALDAFIRRRRG